MYASNFELSINSQESVVKSFYCTDHDFIFFLNYLLEKTIKLITI